MSVTPVVNSGLGAWEAGPALEIRLDEDRAGAGADAFDGVGEGGMDLRRTTVRRGLSVSVEAR